MNARRTAGTLLVIALGALAFSVWGCSKKAAGILLPNQPPTVRLTNAPYSEVTRYYYSITLNWIGFDPDGRIERYLYAIDPPREAGADTAWQITDKSQLTFSFPSTRPDSLSPPTEPRGQDFHVFVLKAEDNRHATSPPATRSFFSYTVAPTVQIFDPPPRSNRTYVTPAVLIQWAGEDIDGVFTKKPVKYKYKLLTNQTDVSVQTALQFTTSRDTVRRYYAPRNWVGWDSTSADTTQKRFSSLIPDQEYVFCVIAFDEAGAYSPTFSFAVNMLYFRVTFAGSNNPTITMFNEFFFYEYNAGGIDINCVPLEVPAGIPLTFNWFATAIPGSAIKSYRWAVDIVDLNDDTERIDDDDLAHWSPRNSGVTSCTIGPYPGGQLHRFYIEAEDINNLKSLGCVRFSVIQASFVNELGIVDDTRLLVDQRTPGTVACMDRPLGLWPTAAELDTFLYARGRVPWACYPAGTITRPGLFNGYSFDTLNTRQGLEDMTVRLSALGRYRHLIWIVDGGAAGNNNPGTDRNDPITALRFMNTTGRSNTLAAYIRQGGQVWLVGAGAPTASMRPWDKLNNNSQPPTPTLTFSNPNGELVPGRFVYDQFHWRSEFKQFKAQLNIVKELGRFVRASNVPTIDYNNTLVPMPASLLPKSLAAGDTFPPNRTVNSSNFYQTQFDIEFLSTSNNITEDYNPGPAEDIRTTLDTLYKAVATALPPGQISPCMTYYHGQDNVPLIISGFNIWNYRKTQCKQLVDFVLRMMWNIQPNPVAASRAAPSIMGGFAAGRSQPWNPLPPGRVGPTGPPPALPAGSATPGAGRPE